MNLNKFRLSVHTRAHTHTHRKTQRWKFMRFVEQMWAPLTSHITALNQQLSCPLI